MGLLGLLGRMALLVLLPLRPSHKASHQALSGFVLVQIKRYAQLSTMGPHCAAMEP